MTAIPNTTNNRITIKPVFIASRRTVALTLHQEAIVRIFIQNEILNIYIYMCVCVLTPEITPLKVQVPPHVYTKLSFAHEHPRTIVFCPIAGKAFNTHTIFCVLKIVAL